jgi:murein DD-endopeptidase MepM/ murein hydrolase activator NlpD
MLDAPVSSDPTAIDDNTPPVTTSDGSALVPIGTANIQGADPAVDQLSIPNAGSISEYTVQAGDSLSEIAQSHGVSTNTILWANNITDPSTIKIGTKLVILPVTGVQHTVKSGETLASIANKFGADATDIAQYNGISVDGTLAAGTTIIIPGGELPLNTPTAPTKSSSTKKSGSTKSSGKISVGSNLSDATSNPYRGGSGVEHDGYFENPVPGAILTQGIHGWNAVDLAVPTGTPIHAAAAGTVILSRTGGWNGGYGNYVIIDHGNGIQTLYAHMSRTAATEGETVSAGEVIGYVGSTGEATGPHVHFEVRGARNPFADCAPMKVCSPE